MRIRTIRLLSSLILLLLHSLQGIVQFRMVIRAQNSPRKDGSAISALHSGRRLNQIYQSRRAIVILNHCFTS